MKKLFIIHPFFFAIFPILHLFAYNIDNFSLDVVLNPIAITSCFALLAWSLLSFVLKSKKKAGLLVSLFLLLFFSYTPRYSALAGLHFMVGGVTIGPDEILLPTWGALFSLGAYVSVRTRRNVHTFTKLFNIVSVALVLISLINIGSYKIKTRAVWEDNKNIEYNEANLEGSKKPAILPHIYYIILDGYARADILKEIYQYDNTELLDYLTQKGFYIAKKSRSNYCQTALSLASSLNFKYLDDLVDQIGIEYSNREPLRNMISNNRAVHFLKQEGYLFVAFSSGYQITEIRNPDIYLTKGIFLDEFKIGLMHTTPVPALLNKLEISYIDNLHRKRILYIFDHFREISKMETPIFVFAHIVAPHPPFVFGRRGEKIKPKGMFTHSDGNHLIGEGGISRSEYLENYREQLIFINNKIKATIDGILSNADSPPVIILQSDHGPGSFLDWEDPHNTYLKERLSILNAYYLPHGGGRFLYDEITPVNTFRIIFNNYFGTNYPLLKDESYFSTWSHPYKFIKARDKADPDKDNNS